MSSHKAVAGARGKGIAASWVEMFGSDRVSARLYADYVATGTSKSWATFKACDTIAKAVQTLPAVLTNKANTKPLTDTPAARLFRVANQRETFGDLLYRTVFWLELTGNAFWYKSEADLSGNKPRELLGLKPQNVKVVVKADGSLAGYRYMVNGEPIPFDPEEVIHFKWPHPDNDYYGLGKVEAARDLMDEQANRSNWAERFWANGAAPSGVFCMKGDANMQDWERLKAKFQFDYGGKRNAGKTAWLNGDWSYIKMGLNAAEMQDLERSRLSTEQIFQLHGVPLSVAGVRDAANYATAEIDVERFREFTILPYARLLEQTLNSDLVAGFGDGLRFGFDVSSLVNLAKLVRDATPLFDRGVLSINELRERAGLQRDDGNPLFSQHFITAGLVPLDLSGIADMGRTEAEAARTVSRFTAQQPPDTTTQ